MPTPTPYLGVYASTYGPYQSAGPTPGGGRPVIIGTGGTNQLLFLATSGA